MPLNLTITTPAKIAPIYRFPSAIERWCISVRIKTVIVTTANSAICMAMNMWTGEFLFINSISLEKHALNSFHLEILYLSSNLSIWSLSVWPYALWNSLSGSRLTAKELKESANFWTGMYWYLLWLPTQYCAWSLSEVTCFSKIALIMHCFVVRMVCW